jgi:hypothetical protein
MSFPRTAWTFEAEVGERGQISLQTPLPPYVRVAVIVLPRADEFADLAAAAQSSLGFWDNPLDDEDWNYGGPHGYLTRLIWEGGPNCSPASTLVATREVNGL